MKSRSAVKTMPRTSDKTRAIAIVVLEIGVTVKQAATNISLTSNVTTKLHCLKIHILIRASSCLTDKKMPIVITDRQLIMV